MTPANESIDDLAGERSEGSVRDWGGFACIEGTCVGFAKQDTSALELVQGKVEDAPDNNGESDGDTLSEGGSEGRGVGGKVRSKGTEGGGDRDVIVDISTWWWVGWAANARSRSS